MNETPVQVGLCPCCGGEGWVGDTPCEGCGGGGTIGDMWDHQQFLREQGESE